MMLKNLASLKMNFMAAVAPDVWQMKYVLNWPASPANLLELPDGFFDYRGAEKYKEAQARVKQQLPAIPGEERIVEEIRRFNKKGKNKDMSSPFEQIADSEAPFVATPKTGRNEPCPCGSGKKYKKCCL